MVNSKGTVPGVETDVSKAIDPDALALLKKHVPDGLKAPLDEKVQAGDFSDYMIDFETVTSDSEIPAVTAIESFRRRRG